MIDFNANLNALLAQIAEQITAPLNERITALEAQVESLIKTPDVINFRSLAFGEAVCSVIENYDFHPKFERMAANSEVITLEVARGLDRHEGDYDHDQFFEAGDFATAFKDAVANGEIEFTVAVL